jgi:hypothetical protein
MAAAAGGGGAALPDVLRALREFADRSAAAAAMVDPADAMRARPSAVALFRTFGLDALFGAVAAWVAAGDAAAVRTAAAALDAALASPPAVGDAVDAGHFTAYIGVAATSRDASIRGVAVRLLRRLAAGEVPLPAGLPRGGLYEGAPLAAAAARVADADTAVADAAADAIFALCGGRLRLAAGVQPGARRPPRLSDTPPADAAAAAAACRAVAAVAAAAASAEPGDGVIDADEPSVVAVRVHALTARLAGAGGAAFAGAASAGLVAGLLDAVGGDDALLAANVLECLPPVARSPDGLAALLDAHVFQRLFAWGGLGDFDAAAAAAGAGSGAGAGAGGAPGEPAEPDPLLGAFALDAVAHMYAEALGAQFGLGVAALRGAVVPAVLAAARGLLAGAGGRDAAAAAAAISALDAVVAADPHAVDVALSDRVLLREWFQLAAASDVGLRAAAIQSVANVMHRAPAAAAAAAAASAARAAGGEPAAAASAVVAGADGLPPEAALVRYHAFFDRVGAHCGVDSIDVLARCLGDATAPRARASAYDALTALVALPGTWGLRRVFGAPGMPAYLLARDTETTKEGREWKFGVVVAALAHPDVGRLGDELVGALRTFRDAGPYAPAAAGPAVATASRPG